jgi:hypothetical protein
VQMLLADGMAPSARVLSAAGVRQLLAPASPPGRSTLLSADFNFRYGEGWFVGPFGDAGAAHDARWHLGSLTNFAAWMVLLPETKQAVVLLINANSELPLGGINAVMSRLPIGVVHMLRGKAPQQGPSLRAATATFTGVALLAFVVIALLSWWAARRAWGGVAMAAVAAVLVVAAPAAGLGPSLLWAFAPELLVVLTIAVLPCAVFSCMAAAHEALTRGRAGRARDGRHGGDCHPCALPKRPRASRHVRRARQHRDRHTLRSD